MGGRRDWEAMLRVIHGISMVDDLDQFGTTVLEEIDALIPSNTSSFNEVDPLAQRATVIGRPRPITASEMELWQKWSHQNPSLMYMLRTGDGSAKRISDFLTTDELHRLELYTYVYAPLDLEYQLAVALPAPQPTVLGIALNRGNQDFNEDEVGLLDALRPHLVQAYRHAQLITEHRHALGRVADTLEEEGRAFHVIGEPLGVHARSLIRAHFGPSSNGIPGRVQGWIEREQSGFASEQRERLVQPLVSVKDGRSLTLRFVPGGKGPDLLWLVERTSVHDSQPLQRLGLSGREAEVLLLLTKGKSTSKIARELRISPGTVKKHLEHVYRKLGVSTATAAIAQAFDVLAR